RVKGNLVLVDGNAGVIERFLGDFAGQAAFGNVNEQQVIVGAAGYDAETEAFEFVGEGASVGDGLRRIGLELGLECLAERNGLGGDDVHERATLQSRKYRGVDLFLPVRLAQDDAAARAA